MRSRSRRSAAWLLVAVAVPAAAGAQQATGAATITLEEALALAQERSPVLRAQGAEVEAARGRLQTARTYPYNPEISLQAARRTSPGGDSTDRAVEASQEIEIGGQRGRRVAVAEASLAAADARLARARRVLAGDVAVAFADVLRARDALRIDEADAAVTRTLLAFEERRLEAGVGTQVTVNLAQASAGRAANRVELARGEYRRTRSALAAVIGLDPAAPPEPAGELSAAATLPPLEDLLRSALERRDDLRALREEERAAGDDVRLQRALARPNLVARAFREREEGTDDINGAGLAVALPLFNRNRGAVAEAEAVAARTRAERELAELAARNEVASAIASYEAASAGAEVLRRQLVGTLEENLRLLQRSFEEGKIGRADLLLFRRELVEGQREFLEALAEARRAQVRLELAAGRLDVPIQTEESTTP
jgi:cobalt-zinc-cadmium efflux system outer membrane protein